MSSLRFENSSRCYKSNRRAAFDAAPGYIRRNDSLRSESRAVIG